MFWVINPWLSSGQQTGSQTLLLPLRGCFGQEMHKMGKEKTSKDREQGKLVVSGSGGVWVTVFPAVGVVCWALGAVAGAQWFRNLRRCC